MNASKNNALLSPSSLFCKAFFDSLPVSIAYIPLSLVWGVLWEQASLPPIWGVIFSVFVFAGAVQFIALSLFLAGAPLWEILASVIPVAARNSFYTLALLEKLPPKRMHRIYLTFGLVDATFALLISKPDSEIRHPWYSVPLTLFIQLYWSLGTIIGVYGGGFIQDGIESLNFALPSLIAVLAMEQYQKIKNWKFPASVILIAISTRILFGHCYFILALLACIVLAICDPFGRKTYE